MNSHAEILVLTNRPEKAANLRFLLRLTNLRIIHIADDIEAFNFLSYRQSSSQPISMVVVIDADIEQPFLRLLDELERCNALLPILLLRGNGPIPVTELSCNVKVRNYVKQCDPCITHSCIRELLDATSSHVVRAS